jgi:hypothetical protein
MSYSIRTAALICEEKDCVSSGESQLFIPGRGMIVAFVPHVIRVH